ncbi:MAG TPA: hypothetical protein VM187_03265 [Niastella sp.]|nr:hypothetical protein [Niastella sp.]
MISVFAGTKAKKIVDYTDLYTSVSEEIEHEEHLAWQEKADVL